MSRLRNIGFESQSVADGHEATTWNFLAHTAGTISNAWANSGSYSARYSPSAAQSISDYVFSTGTGVTHVRDYILVTAYPSANICILDIGSLSAAFGAIYMNSSGQLGINYNVGATSTYGTTFTSTISLNTVHYIELGMDTTTANAQIVTARLDGTQFDVETGSLTLAANSNTLTVWGAGARETGTMTIFHDDIAINDSNGLSDNSWPGAIGPHVKFNNSGLRPHTFSPGIAR